MKELISCGAEISAQTYSPGDTPLHSAAQAEKLDCFRQLIQCGANVNSRNEIGDTPCIQLPITGTWIVQKNWSQLVLIHS